MNKNPGTLKYGRYHEWVNVEGKIVTLGITDYAQESLGDIVFVELPTEGDDIFAGEPYGSVESVKAISDIFSPLNGKVVAVNEAVLDSPDLLNVNPYGAAWLIKVEAEDLTVLDEMMSAEAYEAFLEAGEKA